VLNCWHGINCFIKLNLLFFSRIKMNVRLLWDILCINFTIFKNRSIIFLNHCWLAFVTLDAYSLPSWISHHEIIVTTLLNNNRFFHIGHFSYLRCHIRHVLYDSLSIFIFLKLLRGELLGAQYLLPLIIQANFAFGCNLLRKNMPH